MKESIKLFCIIIISHLTASNSFSTPLNGTYTIGSGGNYSTINSAFTDASLKGIDGAVIFDIITGIYNEQVDIGLISGSSSVNTVTLKSQSRNPADVIINGVSNVFSIYSSFLIIKEITIGSSLYTSVVIHGTSITFTGNNLNNGSIAIPVNNVSFYIYITGNENIGDIDFQGADFGAYNLHIQISDNRINGNVFLLYCFDVLVENNTIGNGISTIYFDGYILKNKIKGYVDASGYIFNNFILGNVYGYGSILRNNTIVGGTVSMPTIVCAAGVYLLNNIIINPSGRTALSSFLYSDNISSSDHNDIYNGGNTNLINYNGTAYNNVLDFYNATGFDQHSNSHPVTFQSSTDLHLAGSSIGDEQLAGIPIASVTDDIDGNPRNPLHPYKGADEVTDFPLPVELASFTSWVSNNNVNLKWTTALEINNSGFDIERRDARSKTQDVWNKIGFVNGNGTVSLPNNYEFTDRNLATGKYNYRLRQIDFNGNYEYHNLADEVVIGIPEKFTISQNFPNPFNPNTKIEYSIPNTQYTILKVYDIAGKEVAILVNEIMPAGRYEVEFDGSNLSSGVYCYKIESGSFSAVKRMTLIK